MKSTILIILLTVSGFYAAMNPPVSFEEKEGMILDAVVRFMDAYHFSPETINDEYSQKAFDLYIDYIDNGKRFLTQEEVDQLKAYENKIDDEVNLRSFEFFEKSMTILEPAHERARNIFNELIEQDVDLNAGGSIQMNPDKREFAQDEEALRGRWKKMLTYDLIDRVNDKLEDQKKKAEKKEVEADPNAEETINLSKATEAEVKEEEEAPKTLEEMKAKAKEEMKESYEKWFESMDKLRRSDRFETYINTLTHLFDPHSDYFNPKEKQDFDIRMGGKLEGIGARLSPDGEWTKVVEIIPGGPAWKGKELEQNDLIQTVRQDEDEEALNIQGMRLDDVVQHIRGKKGTVVHLTVKKTDGTTKTIRIERDEVIIDEGFAKSLILDVPEVIENIGYIKLPRFYDSFEGKVGNSCAKDVAAEIEKLKANNVNGVILDLRNNGGGSLRDVVTMSGLFIEKGPIVQVKPRGRPAYVYDDKDKTAQYQGPLIVMVNQFSASASEILAAALQDYNRAIIVGSNSTFGKGTVQRFVNLDEAFKGEDKFKPLGNLKITMQKFYRVNGGSTQLKGVTPDIVLPNNYHYIETGEKDYEYPMEWTEIDPVEFDQSIYIVENMDAIKANSNERVNASEDFKMVLKNASRLKNVREDTEYPLELDAFSSKINERKIAAEEFDSLYERKIDGLAVHNLPEDMTTLENDESKKARNDEWMEDVNNDFYLEEVMFIMRDMIKMNN